MEEVRSIGSLPCLEHVALRNNPLSIIPDYRTKVLAQFGERASEVKSGGFWLLLGTRWFSWGRSGVVCWASEEHPDWAFGLWPLGSGKFSLSSFSRRKNPPSPLHFPRPISLWALFTMSLSEYQARRDLHDPAHTGYMWKSPPKFFSSST